ncbi:MAG: glycoside hydrolase family 97 catalytic domain-containing protein [bacterium]|nr:glycoside hydrolase family 97 catalytic domain-containing protein [Candidatus Colisoma equi]
MKRIGMVVVGTLCASAAFGERTAVVSPDGKNEIRRETEPTLAFQVFRNGRAMTELSPMSMTVEGRPVLGGAGLKIAAKTAADRTGSVVTPIYKKASVDGTAKGMLVSFGAWSVELVARNDGVAWRYVTDFGDKEVIVRNERIDLAFASGEQTVYATPNYGHGADDPLQNSWEGIYAKHQVKDAPRDPKSAENGLWYAPITFLYPSGETMVVQESDIWDYPGWNFNGTADGRTLTSLFAAYPKRTVYENWGAASRSDKPLRYQRVLEREDFLARTRGTRTYPWRVFALADNVAKIAESDIVFALASPNAIGDASWVKPGKVAWDWWNNWNLTGVNFRAGINTRTYEYYIDFAAKNGIEYVIFDEGWSQHLDVERYNPDMDVPHLVRYANERGVGIILWAAWAQFHGRAERVVSKYAQMGVKGFKVDFMDRDDQLCYEFLRDFAALCAKYRMVVDYHGMSKPAGFARTYPNVLCFEGVQGLENLKGKTREFFPAMDCTIAFTRMAAGPLDYTPGAMRNFCKGTYHPHPNTPGSYGTRVHQMALMVVYEAPLEMLCDSPTQYLANRECFDFMRKLPVVWDETVALEGEMDAFATIARRKGGDWYVGSICGWQGHETEIDTSFLGSGEWTAEIFADGINADRDAVDYAHRTLTVHAGEKIPVKLMPGGGWTAHFSSHAYPGFRDKSVSSEAR